MKDDAFSWCSKYMTSYWVKAITGAINGFYLVNNNDHKYWSKEAEEPGKRKQDRTKV
jgi:hypothetical protein